MPKIGNPLPIDQRRSVQEPILVPATSQPSTQISALKINYMPYQIGQETAAAQSKLREEYGNLLKSVADAKVATQRIERQYAVNDFERGFDNLDRYYQEKMSEAFNPKDQLAVTTEYRAKITEQSKKYSKIFPNATPEEQKYGLQRLSKSLSKATTMEGTYNLTKFKQTDSDLVKGIEDYKRDLTKNVAIDAKYYMEKGIEKIEQRYKIGAISHRQMFLDTKNFVRDSTYGRAELFARRQGRQYAGTAILSGQAFPTREEVIAELYQKLGLYDIFMGSKGGMVGEHVDESGMQMHTFTKDEVNDIYAIYSESYSAALLQSNREFAATESTNERLHMGIIAQNRVNIEKAKEEGTLAFGKMQQISQSYKYLGMPTQAANILAEWATYDRSAPIDLIYQKMINKDGGFYAWAQNPKNGIVRSNGTLDPILLKEELMGAHLHEPTMYKVIKFYRDQVGVLEEEYTKGKLDDHIMNALQHAYDDLSVEPIQEFKRSIAEDLDPRSPFFDPFADEPDAQKIADPDPSMEGGKKFRLSTLDEFQLKYLGKIGDATDAKDFFTQPLVGTWLEKMTNRNSNLKIMINNVRGRVRKDFRMNEGFFAREVDSKGQTKRRLSYEIMSREEGAYVLDTFKSDETFSAYISNLLEEERAKLLPDEFLGRRREETLGSREGYHLNLPASKQMITGGSSK